MSSLTTRKAGKASKLTKPVKANKSGKLHKGPSLWYTAPALIFFGVFALIPLVGVLVLSFMNWDGLGSITFNGIGNWTRMLSDPLVLNAFKLTIILTIVSWAVQTPICILLGTFMAGNQKYRAFLAVFYFLPLLFSSTAVAITRKNLLDPNFGVGKAFGIGWLAHNWLGDPKTRPVDRNLRGLLVLHPAAFAAVPGCRPPDSADHVRGRHHRWRRPGPPVLLDYAASA